MSQKKRVLVAMSGGVDSSVVAGLLKEQGYEVIGVTMQVWDYTQSCDVTPGQGTCCSSIDVQDARLVCDKLEIPFYVINCESKFQAYVIDPFVHEYLEGRTPNPCVNCNTFLKFDHLYKKMKELQCDYLATGHYVRRGEDGSNAVLIRGRDPIKDQSYFLFTLPREILKHLVFPVGDMTKDEVRQHAERMGLLNAKKRDSQEICFVSKLGYQAFIESRVSRDLLPEGNIVLLPENKVVGRHTGIHNFTIGQRKGIPIEHSEALYVIKLDPKSSTVFVGPESLLFTNELVIKKINWMVDPVFDRDYFVKIRYRHGGAYARLERRNEDEITLRFQEPQRAITPGQAAVFYRGETLCGGGWIS